MEIITIPLDKLQVSDLNVRKTLTSEEDETEIQDLAFDIESNGLINPITVREIDNGKYEIIAGQRRYLALLYLKKKETQCHLLKVSNQKAEEISLVENVQRNQMTTKDKVRSYSRLYEVYNKDIEKVVSAIHVSRRTINNYLKIKDLPETILDRLELKGDDKITIEVAIELSKLESDVDKIKVLNEISTLTSEQKIKALKEFGKLEENDIEELKNIRENIAIQTNNIILAPSEPYVKGKNGENIIIPVELYENIEKLIQLNKNKTLYKKLNEDVLSLIQLNSTNKKYVIKKIK
jgi:ParB family chromosome partitioning protein